MEELRDCISRICTFSVLHSLIYEKGKDEVDLAVAFQRIAKGTRDAFSRGEVKISISGESFVCSPNIATNLCVVVNELVTNALKYGSSGADGIFQIKVDLKRENADLMLLV